MTGTKLATAATTKQNRQAKRKPTQISQAFRRHYTKGGILLIYVGLFVGVSVLVNTSKAQPVQPVQSLSPGILTASAAEESSSPLDELSSVDIAVNIAKVTALPEVNSVKNKADTISAGLAVASADEKVVSKPQIVSEGLKSKQDIIKYETKKGDNVKSIAKKFNIKPETIRNSNDLEGNVVNVGTKLLISPVDGLVYKVSSGDTPGSIAKEFSVDKEGLIAINDAELTKKFKVGEHIIIPDGVPKPEAAEPAPTSASLYRSAGTFSYGSNPAYSGNAYAYGWCTYYASAKSGAPGGWGNASTWHIYAPLSGWNVSTEPKVGAIAQRSWGYGGAGHVAIVEDVRQVNGRYEIKYSDMNGLAGFNRVGFSDNWEPARQNFQRFIYR